MARIPEAELERLKAEVSVVRLAEARGVELRRHGRDLIGRCPFHDDREPSLVISPSKNLWHCLGACQAGGSCVDWVMRDRQVSFRHAVELLRSDPPLGPSFAAGAAGATVRTLPAPVALDADDSELLTQVVDFYHRTLRDSPEALAYLERRGLRSSEAVERFRLGFANRTLGLRLPLANRRTGAEIRARLQRLGILRASGHEHFNGSLVVPVVDEAGRVVEIYGRKVTPNLRPGTPQHLYLPGQHAGVWNAATLAGSEEVIVTEALLDGLTLWCLGFRNVTAAYGVEGFTAEHLESFRHHGVKRALIAYDRDEAGDRAAVQLAVRLVGAGVDAFRVQLPQGEDVNSFACAELTSAQDRLAERLRRAVWLGVGRPQGERPTSTSTTAAPIAGTDIGTALAGNGHRPDVDMLRTPGAEPTSAFAASAEPPAAPTTPPATPIPPAATETPVERGQKGDNEVVVRFGDRRWRIRGLGRATTFDTLRVNVLVSRGEAAPETAGRTPFHVDTLDLYSARQRAVFTAQAASELGIAEDVVRRDLGAVLLRCEGLAEEAVRRASSPESTEVVLSDQDQREALQLLRDPQLLTRIVADIERGGVVGEQTTTLVAYLALTSRLLEAPLAVIIQSTSAAGKSAVLEAVLALLPSEAVVKYSAMTGQSLYYMAERDLAHRVLAVVEEEGAERAAYALKLLQSEGELRIASTGKDATTGRLTTHEYEVHGPVAIVLTTTAIDVDEELLNRCLVLTVDEARAQTRAIHERQRQAQTLAGLLAARERDAVRRLHHNAQRLLRPVLVANPYATALTFTDTRTRTRRDHAKYLTLIRTVALLHQHQRERRHVVHGGERVEYIEVTAADIAIANGLADEVLGRSLDELPQQTRRLLLLVDDLVSQRCTELGIDRSDVRLTRKEIREATGWGDTQLKCHLWRLCDLEYLLLLRSVRQFTYELLWDGRGRDGRATAAGLLDPAHLVVAQAHDAETTSPSVMEQGQDAPRSGLQAQRSGRGDERAGSCRASVGGVSGVGRGAISAEILSAGQADRLTDPTETPENAHLDRFSESVVGTPVVDVAEVVVAGVEAQP